MTDVEHYIENAVYFLENGGTYKEFLDDGSLKYGEKQTGISLSNMWEIAQYVVFSYKPCIESELSRKLTELYGYEVEDCDK